MLGQHDIGHRVVVRRIVGVRDGRPVSSDALGELVALTETELTIDTGRGLVSVPLDRVTHAKRVPPRRRPTAADVGALERAAAAAWPAPDTEPLGEWLLRAAGGWTSRANSALAVGDPGQSLPDAIDAVMRYYGERRLPARITTPLPAATSVAGALRARGWTPAPTVLVQTADRPANQTADRSTSPAAGTPAVELTAAPSAAWMQLVAARKGEPPAAARTILSAPVEVRFAHVYRDGRLVAIARGAITGGWLGISLVEVVPGARRQGLARAMTAALARWAADAGVTRIYLQVEERNGPAVALYAGLGFTTHHTYITWTAP